MRIPHADPVGRRIVEGCALVPPRQFIRTLGSYFAALVLGRLGGLGRGLGHSWGRLGRLLGELGGVLGGLGVLGWSWGVFGSVLARPGLRLGVVLGGSGGVLRAS